MKPTQEQSAVVEAFAQGADLTVTAVAGAGKTSTLRMLGEAVPKRRGIYLAYNAAIAREAASKFPATVDCRTAHSLAYRAVGHRYRDRLNGPRVPVWDAAERLGIRRDLRLSNVSVLSPSTQARLALDMVRQFCYSADDDLSVSHLAHVEGIDAPGENSVHRALAKTLLPFAQKAWADLQSPTGGAMKFEHDHYLKIYGLTKPVLDVDYILLDEAQDANPIVAQIFRAQSAQRVAVGDASQAIYGWRGAVDAMSDLRSVDGTAELTLTQSFRFGPAIADLANHWLEALGSPVLVRGTETIPSVVRPGITAKAILTRTNGGGVEELITALQTGRKVHLVGGEQGIKSFVRGAVDLKTKGRSTHPDLCAFTSWGAVQDYVARDSSGADLQTMVRLIDFHGADFLNDALTRTVGADIADVVISTAHRSKGLEWDSVRISSDFEPRKTSEDNKPIPPSRQDLMLRYVAVTRAKQEIDPGPLTNNKEREK